MERVIIVDDEVPFLNYMEKQAQSYPNVQVVGKFTNGLIAKHFLETDSNITIAFMDIQMPVMSGLELAKWINENIPTIKVVLISAHQNFQYAQEAIQANVYDYLCKPFRVSDLGTIFKNVALSRLQDQRQQLYIRDLDRERYNVDLLHCISVRQSDFIRADWIVTIQGFTPGQHTDSMLTTALCNIIRYCSNEVRALVAKNGNVYHAVLMAQNEEKLPNVSCFEQKAKLLLGFEVKVSVLSLSSAEQYGLVPHNETPQEISNIIEEAKKYILNNISTEFNRDDVANAVFMSPSHFSRLFKKEVGISFQDYVKKARIEKVLELLKRDYKISDAATAAGFTNKNYFNEVFKKEIGCSPSEFKKYGKYTGDDL